MTCGCLDARRLASRLGLRAPLLSIARPLRVARVLRWRDGRGKVERDGMGRPAKA